MKKQINRANEQSLSQKNQVSQRNTDTARVRQVKRTVADGRTSNPQQTNAVSQSASAVPAARAQNNVRAQNVAPTDNAQAQNVAGQRSVPQQRLTQVQRPAQVQRSAQVQRPTQAQKPAQTTARRTAQSSSLVPQNRRVQNPVAREMRVQMMKTRTTDIAAVSTDSLKYDSRQKKDKPQKQYSDEGGNTVVSVVKAIVYIIFVIVISVFLALVIINVGNDVFSFVKSDEMVEVTIPEYATLDEVSEILYKNDIIKYPTIFKLYAVAKNADTEFLAGTYSVNGMMNYSTLLGEFKEKPESGTVDITIPEGYTIDEMIDLFVEGYGIGTREGFIDVIQNGEFDYWFIDELEANGIDDGRIYRLEGYLFPDTYQFYKATSEYTVVNKMLKRFSQIFTKDYRAQCEVLGYTVDEMITLASIIEKEAGSPSDFFVVSSVFHNRLNTSWNFPKLESDATIVYVLSHEKGERTNITAADLTLDTPYNTYLYDGFPPGPIANPSASSMLAALLPQKTDFYFFYTYKGVLYPSATKAEHEAIIAQLNGDTTVQQTTGDMPE